MEFLAQAVQVLELIGTVSRFLYTIISYKSQVKYTSKIYDCSQINNIYKRKPKGLPYEKQPIIKISLGLPLQRER